MAAYDGGHASKRQRTEANGFAGGQRGRDMPPMDSIPPSPVVFVRGLSDMVTEADIINDLQSFGPISYSIVISKKRQALIEFEDISGAINLVNFSKNNPVYVAGRSAQFNFSTSQKLERQPGFIDAFNNYILEENINIPYDDFGRGDIPPNNVLLFTVINPQYPITVDVMHTICSSNGKVNRIVIFKKQGVQAMVEFDSIDAATRAKQSLNGADIYSGCCTLKIEFARPTRLNVIRNDNDSWDYTNPTLGQEPERRSALLPDPGPPQPYGQSEPRRDSYDRYGSRPPTDGYLQPPQDRGFQSPVRSDYGPPGVNDPYRRAPAPPSDPYRRQHDPYGRPPPTDAYGAAKEPPLTAGMGQQGAVLMVYGLNPEKMNCTRLFNIFCLYGNVVRVKFLKSKEGAAMVQMGDATAMERVMQYLNNTFFFENKLTLSYSKQAFLQDIPNPVELSDGSKSFMDFMGNRNNRFQNPEAAAKNRIQPPGKTLYYWNAPPGLDEDGLNLLFEESGARAPDRIKIFPARSEKSSTGLMEWEQKSDAIEAMCCCNHKEIENPKSKYPYVMKLCFSGNQIGTSRRPLQGVQ